MAGLSQRNNDRKAYRIPSKSRWRNILRLLPELQDRRIQYAQWRTYSQNYQQTVSCILCLCTGVYHVTLDTMLAPTIESQKSDIFLRKPCLLLVGACIAGPPTMRPAFGTLAAHLSGRKHFPITKKDQQVYRLQVFFPGAPSPTGRARAAPRCGLHSPRGDRSLKTVHCTVF